MPKPNHSDIYHFEADKYDRLISKQPDLMGTLQSIRFPDGLDVIDLGAGTGRLAVPIARMANSVLALDASEAMLRVTADKLAAAQLTNWSTRVSDHRSIAADDHSADMLVSGWSICYVGSSNVEGWRDNVAATMREIERVLRPGGTAVIFETMGTGVRLPAPPDFLTGYYALLEQEYGFGHKWMRLDYSFDSADEAQELAEFFFGAEVAGKVVAGPPATLPECAGVWWRHY
jgi:ubiquinone/menaquinone biosynthesis C-methylase UbiE